MADSFFRVHLQVKNLWLIWRKRWFLLLPFLLFAYAGACMYFWKFVMESLMCVYVCERKRGRERGGGGCVCKWERERECVCLCVIGYIFYPVCMLVIYLCTSTQINWEQPLSNQFNMFSLLSFSAVHRCSLAAYLRRCSLWSRGASAPVDQHDRIVFYSRPEHGKSKEDDSDEESSGNEKNSKTSFRMQKAFDENFI